MRALSEIKNTKYLALTSQLKDYLQFAKSSPGLEFHLYTDSSTKIAAPLMQKIDAGEIKHIRVDLN